MFSVEATLCFTGASDEAVGGASVDIAGLNVSDGCAVHHVSTVLDT